MAATAFSHGTANGYNNHRCRCDACRAAWAEYQASRRTPCPAGCGRLVHSRGDTKRKCHTCTHSRPIKHGTASGYENRGCRCDDCRTAASAARKERKQRRGK
jgi:hypothetical protein